MAARVNPKLTAEWREKIKTSMLINRLNDFVEGKVEMSAAQVTAALGLLRKNLPDLSAGDVSVTVTQVNQLLDQISDQRKPLLPNAGESERIH